MKIAVCVSGQAREGYQDCIDRFKKIFPYDFYFMQWKGHEKPDVPKCFYFDEPPNHYHTMLPREYRPNCKRYKVIKYRVMKEMPKKKDFFKKTKHWHKQLIAHQLLVDKLNGKYDLIIKLRYDVLIHDSDYMKQLFRQMEKKAYEEDITIGFADRKDHALNDEIHVHEHNDCPKCRGYTILDYIMIHKAYRLKNVISLYEDKNLIGAEWGAHQILCGQWNQQFHFLNIRGGCVLFRDYKQT